MNNRFNIAAIFSLALALAWMPAEGTLASPTLIGNSPGIVPLQKEVGTDVATMPLTPSASPLFHDVPSLSRRYSAGGLKFLPYVGAGFGAGYTSELDRAFVPDTTPQQNLNLGSQLGQRMLPNEFQMGIRIPF